MMTPYGVIGWRKELTFTLATAGPVWTSRWSPSQRTEASSGLLHMPWEDGAQLVDYRLRSVDVRICRHTIYIYILCKCSPNVRVQNCGCGYGTRWLLQWSRYVCLDIDFAKASPTPLWTPTPFSSLSLLAICLSRGCGCVSHLHTHSYSCTYTWPTWVNHMRCDRLASTYFAYSNSVSHVCNTDGYN